MARALASRANGQDMQDGFVRVGILVSDGSMNYIIINSSTSIGIERGRGLKYNDRTVHKES